MPLNILQASVSNRPEWLRERLPLMLQDHPRAQPSVLAIQELPGPNYVQYFMWFSLWCNGVQQD